MALIKCVDCETEMSSLATACPKCGRPNVAAAPVMVKPSPASSGKGGWALIGAGIGFILGSILVWQGCAHGQAMNSREMTIAAFGGVVCGILGAILGAVLG